MTTDLPASPRARRVILVAGAGLLALAMVVAYGQGTPATYDPAPLLALLHPEARPGLEQQLGVNSLGDLPLYEIDQAIDDGSATFEGRLTLHWTNRTGRTVSAIPLLLHPNAPEELGADAAGSGSMRVSEATCDGGRQVTLTEKRATLVELTLAPPVASGERLQLRIRYGGRLRSLAHSANDAFGQAMSSLGSISGTGAADYGLVGVGDGLLTFATAYPMLAPWREGGFDIGRPTRYGDLAYNDVANFQVRTIVPKGFALVTNLVDAEPVKAGEGTQVVTSRGAIVRDFVLVGGRDLKSEARAVGRTQVRSWFRARDRAAGERALDTAARSLASFESRFGPYPYVELDIAEATLVGGAGGVEFCGMVLIAGMFYRPMEQSNSQLKMLMDLWGALGSGLTEGLDGNSKRRPTAGGGGDDDLLAPAFDYTVAHEVAHQYFAGLVGCDTHRHPSLDEPMAQYAAALAIEDRDGPEGAKRAMDGNVKLNYALYRLLRGPDAPVLRDVQTFRTGIEYAGLVYGKAPYLYVTLREKLGDDRLHAAIREVVQRHRFRILTTEQWIDELEEASGGSRSGVRDLARRWLEEAHGDDDLGVDERGDFVMASMFDAETAGALRNATEVMGMSPADLLRMLFGGGLPGGAPPGRGIDPEKALELLEQLGK